MAERSSVDEEIENAKQQLKELRERRKAKTSEVGKLVTEATEKEKQTMPLSEAPANTSKLSNQASGPDIPTENMKQIDEQIRQKSKERTVHRDELPSTEFTNQEKRSLQELLKTANNEDNMEKTVLPLEWLIYELLTCTSGDPKLQWLFGDDNTKHLLWKNIEESQWMLTVNPGLAVAEDERTCDLPIVEFLTHMMGYLLQNHRTHFFQVLRKQKCMLLTGVLFRHLHKPAVIQFLNLLAMSCYQDEQLHLMMVQSVCTTLQEPLHPNVRRLCELLATLIQSPELENDRKITAALIKNSVDSLEKLMPHLIALSFDPETCSSSFPTISCLLKFLPPDKLSGNSPIVAAVRRKLDQFVDCIHPQWLVSHKENQFLLVPVLQILEYLLRIKALPKGDLESLAARNFIGACVGRMVVFPKQSIPLLHIRQILNCIIEERLQPLLQALTQPHIITTVAEMLLQQLPQLQRPPEQCERQTKETDSGRLKKVKKHQVQSFVPPIQTESYHLCGIIADLALDLRRCTDLQQQLSLSPQWVQLVQSGLLDMYVARGKSTDVKVPVIVPKTDSVQLKQLEAEVSVLRKQVEQKMLAEQNKAIEQNRLQREGIVQQQRLAEQRRAEMRTQDKQRLAEQNRVRKDPRILDQQRQKEKGRLEGPRAERGQDQPPRQLVNTSAAYMDRSGPPSSQPVPQPQSPSEPNHTGLYPRLNQSSQQGQWGIYQYPNRHPGQLPSASNQYPPYAPGFDGQHSHYFHDQHFDKQSSLLPSVCTQQ